MSGVIWAVCFVAFMVIAYGHIVVLVALLTPVVALYAFAFGMRYQRRRITRRLP